MKLFKKEYLFFSLAFLFMVVVFGWVIREGFQTNEIGAGGDAGGDRLVQTVAATGGAVSDPKTKDTVGAPGIVRPLGSSPERPTFPAASGLGGLEGGPFESYVQMLVKSELASQGMPLAQPFRNVATESFSVQEVIRSAGKYLSS